MKKSHVSGSLATLGLALMAGLGVLALGPEGQLTRAKAQAATTGEAVAKDPKDPRFSQPPPDLFAPGQDTGVRKQQSEAVSKKAEGGARKTEASPEVSRPPVQNSEPAPPATGPKSKPGARIAEDQAPAAK